MTVTLSDGSLRDVTRLCQFVVEPGAIASSTSSGVVLPKADGQGVLRVTFGDHTGANRAPGVAVDLDAAPWSAHRRGPALLQGGLQHGGVPRQFEWQGRLPAELAGRRPGIRSCVALARRQRTPREPDRTRAQLGPAQADGVSAARRRKAVRSTIRSRPARSAIGSKPALATKRQARLGSVRCGSSRRSES